MKFSSSDDVDINIGYLVTPAFDLRGATISRFYVLRTDGEYLSIRGISEGTRRETLGRIPFSLLQGRTYIVYDRPPMCEKRRVRFR
jgi:hypothetical protein